MKRFILLIQALLASSLLLLVGCGGSPAKPSTCTLTVECSLPGYAGLLLAADGSVLDTLRLDSGSAVVELTDSASMPYMAYVHLLNPSDSIDTMDMPLVVEGGHVKVSIGEYISTSGTPQNAALQRFLNSLQAFSDGMKSDNGLTLEELYAAYSSFYRTQILENRGTVVGDYILDHYGVHLTDADRKSVEAVMND